VSERVGRLQLDDRYWQVYFLELPIACFDSRKLRMLPLPKQEGEQSCFIRWLEP